MIVPRSFAGQGIKLSEKSEYGVQRSRSSSRSRSKSPFSLSNGQSPSAVISRSEPRSSPVQIPLRHSKDADETVSFPSSLANEVEVGSQMTQTIPRPRKESVHNVLSSTTIPMRRKLRGRPSQRLPKGDHVADFSRLMQDDMRTRDGSPSRSMSSSYMDALFGNIDGLVEGQMIVGSEGVDETILATRSISSESLVSLASPEDYSTSGLGSYRSSLSRSYETRRLRQLASSQDCASDHPLIPTEIEEVQSDLPEPAPTPKRSPAPVTGEKKSRSFKSSLTASLKAIKSAAQSVSSKAALFAGQDSEDYLARSFFDIQPFLTDDKRPPPANNPPSPQLRRYLNPYSSSAHPDSPAHLHFWQDERNPYSSKQSKKPKLKSRRKPPSQGPISSSSIDKLPPVVQLSTCLPPSVRTANASSPPIWLNPDGTPSNKQTASPLLHDPDSILENSPGQPRHREPRENRDFLRVFVCEMEMRRHGKLSADTSTSRARLWLPPVSDDFKGPNPDSSASEEICNGGNARQAAERWKPWNIDEI